MTVAHVGQGQNPTANETLAEAVDQIRTGLGTLFTFAMSPARLVVQLTGTEKGVAKINTLIKDNADLIFWALALVNMWQHWILFSIGLAGGLAIAKAGSTLKLVSEPVQILKTNANLLGYNYLSGVLFLVLAPWLSSLQSGLVTGNLLGNPTVR